VCFVEQPNMDNDLAWLSAWLGLKPHAQPAMRFISLFETARCNRIGEDKERFVGSKFLIQPLDQKIVLMIEHFLEPRTADVSVSRSVNSIAEGHVISRHGFGDCARSAADAKKSARYFLSRANFSESTVFR